MSSEALMDKAKAFFDRKTGTDTQDHEVNRWMKRVEKQLKVARKDKDYKQSLIKTLSLLEREAKSRTTDLEARFATRAAQKGRNLDGDKLTRLARRALPPELRVMQKQGMDVLTQISSAEKLNADQLRKFVDQTEAFTAAVEDLRAGKQAFAQEKGDSGISLTERIRQYREGRLLDDSRHKQLLEKLGDIKPEEKESKYGDAKKLGLMALFGPAAPIMQLWSEFSDDMKKMGLGFKELKADAKERFAWWKEQEETKENAEEKQTNMLGRMLKAIKERGKKGGGLLKKGLGWLFGGGDDMDFDGPDRRRRRGSRMRRWGRSIGRTAGRAGRGLGGLARGGARALGGLASGTGSALAGVARFATPVAAGLSALQLASLLSSDASTRDKTVQGSGIAGGLAGGLAGGAAGAALGSVVPGVGNVVGGLVGSAAGFFLGKEAVEAGVAAIWDNADKAGKAISDAATGISNFFSTGFDKAKGAFNSAVDSVGEVVTAGGAAIKTGYQSAVDGMSSFFETAVPKLEAGFEAYKETMGKLAAMSVKAGAAIRDKVSEGLDYAGTWFADKSKSVGESFSNAKSKLGKFFSDSHQSLVDSASSLIERGADTIGSLKDKGSEIAKNLQARMGAGAEALTTAYKSAGANIKSFFSEKVEAAGTMLTDIRKRVAQEGMDIQKALSEKLLSVTGMFEDWSKQAKDKLSDFWDELGNKASKGFTAVVQAVKQVPAAAADAARTVAKKADAATGGAVRKAAEFFQGESKGLGVGRFTEEEQKSIEAARAQGDKFRGGSGLTAETKALIVEQANAAGVNPEHMLAMAQMESGGNANAVSATGATGLFQFTGGTGKAYGIKNRFDPKENAAAAARLMADNAKALKAKGIEPTLENLYLAHQQGAGGAAQIINATNGNGQISAEVQKNMGLNYGNMTAEQYLAKNKEKIEKARTTALTKTYEGQYAKTVDEKGNVIPTAVAAAPAKPGTQVAAATPGTQVAAATPVKAAGAPVATQTVAAAPVKGTATVTTAPTGGYERATPPSAVAAAPQAEPPKQQQMASTMSANKVGLSDSDFHISDLGLIVMNRGYAG